MVLLLPLLCALAAAEPPTLEALLTTRSPLVRGEVWNVTERLGLSVYAEGLPGATWAMVYDEGTSFEQMEWHGDGEIALVYARFAEPLPGTGAHAQARAIGVELTDEVSLLVRHRMPPSFSLAESQRIVATNRRDLFLAVTGGQVLGVVRWRRPPRPKDGWARPGPQISLRSAPDILEEVAETARWRGPHAASLVAAYLELPIPAAAGEADGVGDDVRRRLDEAEQARLGAIDAALTTAEEALAAEDPRAWGPPWRALRDTLAEVDAQAFAKREGRVRAYEDALRERLAARGATDDLLGLVLADAHRAITPSEDEAAVRERALGWLVRHTPVLVADGRVDDGLDLAWNAMRSRSFNDYPGLLDLSLPDREGALAIGRTLGVEPVRVETGPPEILLRVRTEERTARRGTDEGGYYDNSAAVARWEARRLELEAEIAAWHREHPYGAHPQYIATLRQLQRFLDDHLGRRPQDSGYAAKFVEHTWSVSCQDWTASATVELSIPGTSSRETVEVDASLHDRCRHGAVPALGLAARDDFVSEAYMRERQIPAAIGFALKDHVQPMAQQHWRSLHLEPTLDELERSLRASWLYDGEPPELVLPDAPLAPSAEGVAIATVSSADDATLADLVLSQDATCVADIYPCPELWTACRRGEMGHRDPFETMCVRYKGMGESPGVYLPLLWDALKWAHCVYYYHPDDGEAGRDKCRWQ